MWTQHCDVTFKVIQFSVVSFNIKEPKNKLSHSSSYYGHAGPVTVFNNNLFACFEEHFSEKNLRTDTVFYRHIK